MTDFAVAPASQTTAQRDAARARANEIRSLRAALKREIAGGRPVVPLIQEPPDWLLTMKVWELVASVRGVGRAKARRILDACHVDVTRTVGGLNDRQRRDLTLVLAGGDDA